MACMWFVVFITFCKPFFRALKRYVIENLLPEYVELRCMIHYNYITSVFTVRVFMNVHQEIGLISLFQSRL